MSGKSGVTTSSAGDAQLLDQSPSHSAVIAGDAASQQLKEMSLSADGSHNIDKLLPENCSSSDVNTTETAVAATDSQTQLWTSEGFVSGLPDEVASNHLPSLDVGDRLNSALTSVGSVSNQQLSVFSGSNFASVNHVTPSQPMCECFLDNGESVPLFSEPAELFSCHECSITCSKHVTDDSLHIVLHVVRHSEVDCSVFADASLVVLKNEIYLTKVIMCHRIAHSTFVHCHYIDE